MVNEGLDGGKVRGVEVVEHHTQVLTRCDVLHHAVDADFALGIGESEFHVNHLTGIEGLGGVDTQTADTNVFGDGDKGKAAGLRFNLGDNRDTAGCALVCTHEWKAARGRARC